ncbi:MAG: CAP domain-containing protein [Hyphomicrobiales bacterium]
MTGAITGRSALIVTSALIVGLTLGSCGPDRTVSMSALYTRLDQAGQSFDPALSVSMINGYRRDRGLPPLVFDATLAREAELRASNAAKADRSTPGEVPDIKNEETPDGRTIRLSAGYRTAAEAFSGWRDVPAHNAALLSRQATRIGVAAHYWPSSRYRMYWAIVTSTR